MKLNAAFELKKLELTHSQKVLQTVYNVGGLSDIEKTAKMNCIIQEQLAAREAAVTPPQAVQPPSAKLTLAAVVTPPQAVQPPSAKQEVQNNGIKKRKGWAFSKLLSW
jgi:hypothetical protein